MAYGMPQPNTYGQYGYPGFAGFPGQAAGAPGAAPGSQGMPQANTAAGGLGLPAGAQPAAVDPNAAAAGQAAQGQWGSDPNYYANYWGGTCPFFEANRLFPNSNHQVTMVSRLPANKGTLRCKALSKLSSSSLH